MPSSTAKSKRVTGSVFFLVTVDRPSAEFSPPVVCRVLPRMAGCSPLLRCEITFLFFDVTFRQVLPNWGSPSPPPDPLINSPSARSDFLSLRVSDLTKSVPSLTFFLGTSSPCAPILSMSNLTRSAVPLFFPEMPLPRLLRKVSSFPQLVAPSSPATTLLPRPLL